MKICLECAKKLKLERITLSSSSPIRCELCGRLTLDFKKLERGYNGHRGLP